MAPSHLGGNVREDATSLENLRLTISLEVFLKFVDRLFAVITVNRFKRFLSSKVEYVVHCSTELTV